MAQLIEFPRKIAAKDDSLNRLAHKIMAHLTVVLYERDIMDIPVQAFVKEMCTTLVADGFEYDRAVLEEIGNNPDTMKRIETMFMNSLVDRGYIPASKA
ncbi:MAG: hypothetical protein EOP83_01600 [Verrucomicrobiaceae bacterium]|nr:MAG: hypothetical protein EOP83_01600 [Verrucomicrobiaceae bacterium]